jgi:hypothetical protein
MHRKVTSLITIGIVLEFLIHWQEITRFEVLVIIQGFWHHNPEDSDFKR